MVSPQLNNRKRGFINPKLTLHEITPMFNILIQGPSSPMMCLFKMLIVHTRLSQKLPIPNGF